MSNELNSPANIQGEPRDQLPIEVVIREHIRNIWHGKRGAEGRQAEAEVEWHQADKFFCPPGEEPAEALDRGFGNETYVDYLLKSGIYAVASGDTDRGMQRLGEAEERIRLDLDVTDKTITQRLIVHRSLARALWQEPANFEEAEENLKFAYNQAILNQGCGHDLVSAEVGNVVSYWGRLLARKFGAGILSSLDPAIAKLEQADTTFKEVSETPSSESSPINLRPAMQENLTQLSLVLGISGDKQASLEILQQAVRLGYNGVNQAGRWALIAASSAIYFSVPAQRRLVSKLIR